MNRLIMKMNKWIRKANRRPFRMSEVLPVRCQLCGKWGHSSSGQKWICDACFAQIVSQEARIPYGSRRLRYCDNEVQSQMELNLF